VKDLKSQLKRLLIPAIFIPKFLASNNKSLKPFFGFPRNPFGPRVRTTRLIDIFGNYVFRPNILYVQSGWSREELKAALLLRKKINIPIVFNQNGLYYPAWYNGNWQENNELLVEVQKNSYWIIFQSNYCKLSQHELTGYLPTNYSVIHNSMSCSLNKITKISTKIVCVINHNLDLNCRHIFEPLLAAWDILIQKLKHNAPTLRIIGDLDPMIKDEWYVMLQKKMNYLKELNLLQRYTSYNHKSWSSVLDDADIALHLRDKDACPNAVIERMSVGLPHIYINSGGTPELIDDAGIMLNVEKGWDKYNSVNEEELADAVIRAINLKDSLGLKAHERYKSNFNWDKYVKAHKDIFHNSLLHSTVHEQ
jgi:glycosyltransferase involved in cell wall biosynthesis